MFIKNKRFCILRRTANGNDTVSLSTLTLEVILWSFRQFRLYLQLNLTFVLIVFREMAYMRFIPIFIDLCECPIRIGFCSLVARKKVAISIGTNQRRLETDQRANRRQTAFRLQWNKLMQKKVHFWIWKGEVIYTFCAPLFSERSEQ